MNSSKNTAIRASFYFAGLSFLTLGIALSITSQLGASPFDALLVGLNKTVGLTVGSWEYILGAILLIINSIILKKKPDLIAMLTAFATGLGIDFWLFVSNNLWAPTVLWEKVLFFIFGLIFIGLGISTYLQAEFAPSPLDGTMLVIRDCLGVKISTAKNLLMSIFLILALMFDGPVAIGTLIMVLASGPTIGWFYPIMESLKNKKLSTVGTLKM